MDFTELRLALALRAIFQDFIDQSPPGRVPDDERARGFFLTRWTALPEMMQGGVTLSLLVRSPLLQGTPEVIETKALTAKLAGIDASMSRVN